MYAYSYAIEYGKVINICLNMLAILKRSVCVFVAIEFYAHDEILN